MNINENKEFETINRMSRERTAHERAVLDSTVEIYHARKVKATKKAIFSMIATMVGLIVAIFGISVLEMIGWISNSFRTVLVSVAGYVAMFLLGYFWHDTKN